MPNMSRRHISSYDKYTNTDSFSASRLSNFLRTRQIDETNTFYSVIKKNILSVLISIFSVVHLFWKPFSYLYRFIHSVCITVATGIYLGTSGIMLLDTLLLRSNRNYSKAAALTALCVIPFLLIGGFQLYFCLVSGFTIAPSCHPNCGKIVISYLKSMTNDFYSVFKAT